MKRLIVIIITLSLILSNAKMISAEEPIECNGDQVEYFEKEDKVVGSGNVLIKYQNMELACDRVTVWTKTYDALAEGNVKLTQGENYFSGDRIKYNFKSNIGDIENFSGYSDEWYVKGKDAERVSEEKIIVDKAYVTTCDHERPHWKMSAKRVEVYPEIMVKTYNAVAWINPFSLPWNIPVMWIPWYCHPIDDDRPHVTVIPGKNSQWGNYLLTAWRYTLSPNHKGYVNLDYRERKDGAVGIEHVYDTNSFGKGNITTYYMNERNIARKHSWYKWYKSDEKDLEPTTEQEKAFLRIRHQWEMAPQTLLTAEMHKYKDKDFLKDYFFDEYEKDETPRSYMLLTNTSGFCNLSVLAQKRMNRFEQVIEKLPEINVNVNDVPIKFGKTYEKSLKESQGSLLPNGGFYYTAKLNAANFNRVYPRHTDEDPGTITDPHHNNRLDAYNKLSYKTKLAFISLTPFIATRHTYFDREVDNKNSQLRSIFEHGIEASTKFFKIFRAKGRPLGMEINDLRHVITPTLEYKHRPPPSMSASKVAQFDSIDSIGRTNAMTFGLENKLQTKRGDDLKSVDLAMLLVETGYDFRHTPGGQLSNYTAKLELRPFDWLSTTSNATFNPHMRYHRQWLRQMSNNLSFHGKDWSVGVGHNYTHESNSLTLNANINTIPGWKFSVYEDVNVLGQLHDEKKKWDLREQQYVITKDLHCWWMDVRYNVKRDMGEEIMVIFRLKAFPDIPFEFGKEYHRPKVGSQDWETRT